MQATINKYNSESIQNNLRVKEMIDILITQKHCSTLMVVRNSSSKSITISRQVGDKVFGKPHFIPMTYEIATNEKNPNFTVYLSSYTYECLTQSKPNIKLPSRPDKNIWIIANIQQTGKFIRINICNKKKERWR